MNLLQLIKQKEEILSNTDKKIAEWIIENPNEALKFSIKQIAFKLNISISSITKFFKKIGLEGFKDIKKVLTNISSDYLQNINSRTVEYKQTLVEDIIHTLNDLNFELISSICNEIVQGTEIIIFATGNTRVLAQFFYFILETMGYRVKLISSLYDLDAYNVDQKIIVIISISGINTKCERFLNIIKNKKPLMKIAISASEQCSFKDNVDFHLYGYVNNFIYVYNKSVPLNDKYLVLLILDNFIIELYKKNQLSIDERIREVKA